MPIPSDPRTAADLPESKQELQASHDAEIAAIHAIAHTIQALPLGAQRRVLTYLFARFITDPEGSTHD